MPGSPRDLAVARPLERIAGALARPPCPRRARASARGAALQLHRCPRCSTHAARCASRATSPTSSPGSSRSGRSRARRRAAQLRFVPAGSRAKRVSLGALAALTVGPTASLASGQSTGRPAANPEPATTTEHVIVLSAGSEGRQVQLLQKALGDQGRRRLRPRNRSRRAQLPGQQTASPSTASSARRRAPRCAPRAPAARSSPTSAARSPAKPCRCPRPAAAPDARGDAEHRCDERHAGHRGRRRRQHRRLRSNR